MSNRYEHEESHRQQQQQPPPPQQQPPPPQQQPLPSMEEESLTQVRASPRARKPGEQIAMHEKRGHHPVNPAPGGGASKQQPLPSMEEEGKAGFHPCSAPTSGANSAAQRISVVINGFGKPGCVLLLALLKRGAPFDVLVINDTVLAAEDMALLFNNTPGHFPFSACGKDNKLCITFEDKSVVEISTTRFLPSSPSADVPWRGVSVLETSGTCTTVAQCVGFINAGALMVVIAAPSEDAPTFVMGCNEKNYRHEQKIISSASFMTVSLAPLLKMLNDKFPIKLCRVTQLGDSANIIPFTRTTKAVAKLIPDLEGKLAVTVDDTHPFTRVVNLTCELEHATRDKLIDVLKASKTSHMGDCNVKEVDSSEQLVLIDQTFFRLTVECDERGYANRILDLLQYVVAPAGVMQQTVPTADICNVEKVLSFEQMVKIFRYDSYAHAARLGGMPQRHFRTILSTLGQGFGDSIKDYRSGAINLDQFVQHVRELRAATAKLSPSNDPEFATIVQLAESYLKYLCKIDQACEIDQAPEIDTVSEIVKRLSDFNIRSFDAGHKCSASLFVALLASGFATFAEWIDMLTWMACNGLHGNFLLQRRKDNRSQGAKYEKPLANEVKRRAERPLKFHECPDNQAYLRGLFEGFATMARPSAPLADALSWLGRTVGKEVMCAFLAFVDRTGAGDVQRRGPMRVRVVCLYAEGFASTRTRTPLQVCAVLDTRANLPYG
eukprot:TRINITY_DN825_c0_g1_i2.p1 TRINITY_DN825_c0_g1~~TRINITY_DN825_c0_g1_i2.p1  ORF type:complete len:733 (+),score=120.29 TRINITY_DN825_c0_g1_i2:34-2199(+)